MCKVYLIPYIVAAIILFVLDYKIWSFDYLYTFLKQYILGLSFTRRLFDGIGSVGPIYFILLLFAVRLLYTLIDNLIKNDILKATVILAISLFGMLLGNRGYWLPWSFDIACYAIIYYYLGVLAKKHKILDKIKESNLLILPIIIIWLYMVYTGSMEIAIRNYGSYFTVVLGALCGTLLIYKLSFYISSNPGICVFLSHCGKYSIDILIVHRTLGGIVGDYVGNIITGGSIFYKLSCIFIQVILGILFGFIIDKCKQN